MSESEQNGIEEVVNKDEDLFRGPSTASYHASCSVSTALNKHLSDLMSFYNQQDIAKPISFKIRASANSGVDECNVDYEVTIGHSYSNSGEVTVKASDFFTALDEAIRRHHKNQSIAPKLITFD